MNCRKATAVTIMVLLALAHAAHAAIVDAMAEGSYIVNAGETSLLDICSWSGGGTLTKAGDGVAVLCTTNAAVGPDSLIVSAGTLKLAAPGTTNRFWRVTFKRSVRTADGATGAFRSLVICPFRLFTRDHRVADYSASPAWSYSSTITDAAMLPEKKVICSRSDFHSPASSESDSLVNITAGEVGTVRPWNPTVLFSANPDNACVFDSEPYPVNGDSSTWVVMTFRIPENGREVAGYDLWARRYSSYLYHPRDWTLETSPDGTHWALVDSQTNQRATDNGGTGNGRWYHWGGNSSAANDNANPYRIVAYRMGGGIPDSAEVKVMAGATLDASLVSGGQMVSRLTVDCTAGGGTLRGVALAANGTLNLVNIPAGTKLSDYVVPISFATVANTGNANSWTVLVNGVSSDINVVWKDGGFYLPASATIIYIR